MVTPRIQTQFSTGFDEDGYPIADGGDVQDHDQSSPPDWQAGTVEVPSHDPVRGPLAQPGAVDAFDVFAEHYGRRSAAPRVMDAFDVFAARHGRRGLDRTRIGTDPAPSIPAAPSAGAFASTFDNPVVSAIDEMGGNLARGAISGGINAALGGVALAPAAVEGAADVAIGTVAGTLVDQAQRYRAAGYKSIADPLDLAAQLVMHGFEAKAKELLSVPFLPNGMTLAQAGMIAEAAIPGVRKAFPSAVEPSVAAGKDLARMQSGENLMPHTAGGWAYTVGEQALPLAAGIGGGLVGGPTGGAAAAGVVAAGQQMAQDIAAKGPTEPGPRGSNERARRAEQALQAGMVEGATSMLPIEEVLGGPIAKAVGKKLVGEADTTAKKIAQRAISTSTAAGSEGTQEGSADVVNALADYARGDPSAFNNLDRKAMQSFILGTAVGAPFGAVGAGAHGDGHGENVGEHATGTTSAGAETPLSTSAAGEGTNHAQTGTPAQGEESARTKTEHTDAVPEEEGQGQGRLLSGRAETPAPAAGVPSSGSPNVTTQPHGESESAAGSGTDITLDQAESTVDDDLGRIAAAAGHPVTRAAPDHPAAKAADAALRRLGVEPVWFTSPGESVEGMAPAKSGKRVYLRVGMGRGRLARVVQHELYHRVRTIAPDLWARLRSVVGDAQIDAAAGEYRSRVVSQWGEDHPTVARLDGDAQVRADEGLSVTLERLGSDPKAQRAFLREPGLVKAVRRWLDRALDWAGFGEGSHLRRQAVKVWKELERRAIAQAGPDPMAALVERGTPLRTRAEGAKAEESGGKETPASRWTKDDLYGSIVREAGSTPGAHQDFIDQRSAETDENVGAGYGMFTFKGGLPTEVKEAIEHQPHLRFVFKTGKDGTGADHLASMGLDKYLARAEAVFGTDTVPRALKHLRSSPEPEHRFLAAVHDNMPDGKGIAKTAVAGGDLKAGSTFTIDGHDFEVVTHENGYTMLRDGEDYPLVPAGLVDAVPIDKGSLKTPPRGAKGKVIGDDGLTAAERGESGSGVVAGVGAGQDEDGYDRSTPPPFSVGKLPEGTPGALGRIYNKFRGNFTGALEFLRRSKDGEAVGVLTHPDVPGPISLIYGKPGEGSEFKNGMGVAHIDAKHPGALDELPKVWPTLARDPREVHPERITLASPDGWVAVVKKDPDVQRRFLLTMYSKEERRASGRITGLPGTTAKAGVDGTAPPAQRSGDHTPSSDDRFSVAQDDLGFVRKAEKIIDEKMKGPMPAADVRSMLLNNGVSADEMKWSGWDDFLGGDRGKVTPAQVREFQDSNRVVLKERVLGAARSDGARVAELVGTVDRSYQKARAKLEPYLKTIHGAEAARTAAMDYIRNDGLPWAESVKARVANWDRLGPETRAVYDKIIGDEGLRDARDTWVAAVNEHQKLLRERDANDTHYETYTLPGGTNYREVLLTLPEKAGPRLPNEDQNSNLRAEGERLRGTFRSGHFNDPNIIAHARVKDRRTLDGRKVLHIEEIQSDWHQQGREQGYQGAEVPTDAVVQRSNGRWHVRGDSQHERDYVQREHAEALWRMLNERRQVPAAPFAKTWHEMTFRRLLRMAAEGGYDAVGWTTGEQQNGRYGATRSDADQAGMGYFYDDMLPRYADKYAKKWGAKVEDGQVLAFDPAGKKQDDGAGGTVLRDAAAVDAHLLPVTPAMRESVVKDGQPLFSVKPPVNQAKLESEVRDLENKAAEAAGTNMLDRAAAAALRGTSTNAWKAGSKVATRARRLFAAAAAGDASKPKASTQEVLAAMAEAEGGAKGDKPLGLIPEPIAMREALAAVTEARRKDAYGRALAEDYLKMFTKGSPAKLLRHSVTDRSLLTAENQVKVFDALDGKMKVEDLPDGLREPVKQAIDHIDALRKAMVQEGIMTPETYERYKGRYIPYKYQRHEREKLAERTILGMVTKGTGNLLRSMKYTTELGKPRLSDKYVILDQKGKPIGDAVNKSPGWSNEIERDQALDKIILDRLTRDINAARALDGKAPLERGEINASTASALPEAERAAIDQQRRKIAAQYSTRDPFSSEDYAAAGRIDDPGYLVAHAIIQANHDVQTARLFDAIAGMGGLVHEPVQGTPPPSGFIRMPNSPRYGPLSGKDVRARLAHELIGVGGVTHADVGNAAGQIGAAVADFYDQALRLWKKGKTVYNPATHGRNLLGNIIFADLAGINPALPQNWRHFAAGARALATRGGALLREMHEQGVLAGDEVSAELRERLHTIIHGPAEAGNPVMAMFRKVAGGIDRGAESAYHIEDAIFRAAAFAAQREAGSTPRAAAEWVRTWFPSYDRIPKSIWGGAVRTDVMRRIIPFYSFSHEAVRIFAEGMKKKPLRMAMWLVAPTALSMASRAILGLDDDEFESVKQEMRGKVGGVPVFSILLPFRDSQGRLQQWDLTNIVPWSNPMGLRLDQGDGEDTKTFAQNALQSYLASNPVSGMGQAFVTNRDPFFDRNIVQEGMTGGEQAKAWAMYAARQLLPPLVGRDALNAVADPPTGPAPSLLRPDRIPRGFDQKRGVEQTYARGVVGLDLRSAEPRVSRLVGDWLKKTGTEASRTQQVDTTARQRAGDRLFQAIRNKDVEAMAEAMSDLQDEGANTKSPKQIRDRLQARHPLEKIKEEDRRRFMAGLSKVDKDAVQRSIDEWDQTARDAASMRGRAIGLMRPRKAK